MNEYHIKIYFSSTINFEIQRKISSIITRLNGKEVK